MLSDNLPVSDSPPISPTYLVTVRKTLDKGTVKEGPDKTHPIFEGYELKGKVYSLPIAGERWVVARTERNGVQVLGLFQTTEVEAVWHDENPRQIVFETKNSRYFCEYILDNSP